MREKRERDLERELQTHLELEAEEQQQAGLSSERARYAARRALGNMTLIREVTRQMWGWTSWQRLWQDLRYAARMLRQTPGFTVVAVLSLALGIGANTAIFSLLNAVILRTLPVPDPQQLVQFTYTVPGPGPNNWNSWMGYPQLERFRAQSRTFTGIFGGVGLGGVNVELRGTAGLASGNAFTDNFFSVLGLKPEYGRLFTAGDDGPDASAMVLTDAFWRRRFGADPSIIGSVATVNQTSFTVVGITPPGFTGITLGSRTDFWVPLHALDRIKPAPNRWMESFTSWLQIAGRIRPGGSREQAQAEEDVLHRQLLAEQLAASRFRSGENMQRFVRESHLVLRPAETGMLSGLRNTYEMPLKLLMWVAGVVLLIASANVANLLLARASNRRREIALRLALGAGRARVIRQLLTEGLLLALMGGIVALAIAWWGSNALVRTISTGDRLIPLDVRPDWLIFKFHGSGVAGNRNSLRPGAGFEEHACRSRPHHKGERTPRHTFIARAGPYVGGDPVGALAGANRRRRTFCAHSSKPVERGSRL